MKIVNIETYHLSDQLSQSFYFSQWHYHERKICIVKVTADNGLVGWGEGYGPASLVQAGIEFLKPFVLGQNVLHSEVIWSKMYRRSLDFARRGILLSAVSALDVAIWDLKGKFLEQPVCVLLGGKKREYITPYATGMYFREAPNLADQLAEEASQYAQQGFKAMKMKVGLSIERDLANVEAVRQAIGPELLLMVDANHAYNLREATQLAKLLEPHNIYWFEEPISPEYYHQYAELRQKTTIPIAAGECEFLRFGFQQLMSSHAVDIVQPDICATGGLTEAKRIADLAYVYGIEVVPHTWGTSIALAAAIHFVHNLEEIPGRLLTQEMFLEYDRTENALREELTSLDMTYEQGKLSISDRPGLGVTVNEDLLVKFVTQDVNEDVLELK